MKKFFKASSSLTNPVSFLSSKFGKKKHATKEDKELISDIIVDIKIDETKLDASVIEEDVIQQEGGPLDETVVGTMNTVELIGDRKPTQVLMINKSDETFSAANMDRFLSPEVDVIAPIQMNMSSVNTLKFYQAPTTTKNPNILPTSVKNNYLSDVVQKKIDDLEKTSHQQSLEIEQLKSSINECLTRLDTLESKKIKGHNSDAPLKLSTTKGKDVQLRQSLVTPRAPVKNARLSATLNRRSISDIAKQGRTRKRPWKPPGGTAVIICPILIKKGKPKKNENPQPQRISFAIFNDLCDNKHSKHTSTPWRPAGISLLFCNLSNYQISKHIRRNVTRQLMTPPKPIIDYHQHVVNNTDSVSEEENHKETTFLKGEGALKIFMRGRPVNLYAPSSLAESFNVNASVLEPNENLRMEWVYGYRGKDCRKNLYYLPTGDLVYFVAGIVVLHNLEKQVQRHYTEHTDDIKCLALHPDKVSFASGQVAGHSKSEGKPHVRIWSSLTLQTLHVIGIGFFERAVAALAFSKSDGGFHLCTVDEANDHNVTLWNWSKKQSIASTKSSTEAVIDVEFHPKDSTIFVTCGKSHLAFWTVEKTGLTKKTVIFEKYEKPKVITCITFTDDGDLISGDSNGNIYFWNKDKRAITRAIIKAHNGSVSALLISEDKTLISGGSKDNSIFEWDLSTKEKSEKSFSLNTEYGFCRSICEKSSQLIAGTTLNCIVNLHEGKCEPILVGHSDEICAVYNNLSKPTFVSGGFDQKLIVWNCETHDIVSTKRLNKKIHSIGLNATSALCVVGFDEGHWLVCDLSTGDDVHQGNDGIEVIQCCEFNPDGSHLALGSRDNHIYVYKIDVTSNQVTKVGKCVGHSSFITHLDWSSDGEYLRTNSGDYELLFWTVSDCKQVKAASSLADIAWATCNCALCFEVAGIWPEGSDGTDINAVAKAHLRPIMATADDFGKVNLYRYPASQPKAAHKTYAGHSSHVTGVAFMYDDRRVVSVGGQDMAVVQWLVV